MIRKQCMIYQKNKTTLKYLIQSKWLVLNGQIFFLKAKLKQMFVKLDQTKK